MNRNQAIILSAIAVNGVIGVVLGTTLAYSAAEKKWIARADAEIEDMAQTKRLDFDKEEDLEAARKYMAEMDRAFAAQAKIAEEQGYVDPVQELRVDSGDPEAAESDEAPVMEERNIFETSGDSKEDPYLISEEEFLEEKISPSDRTLSFEYYREQASFLDDSGQLVMNPEDLFGGEVDDWFNQKENMSGENPYLVHIRNPKMDLFFEIALMEGDYLDNVAER